MLRTLPIRFVAVPLLAGAGALAVGWLAARRAPRASDIGSPWAERDPLGPAEGVVLVLERTTSMKISTEAEALSCMEEDDT